MTEQRAEAVSVTILDKEYLVSCPPDERDALLASARYLDQKMREIRDSGKVIGADRIAVMAALNIAHELLARDSEQSQMSETLAQRLRRLQEKIEGALFQSQQLEF